jgi:hypothetical protein
VPTLIAAKYAQQGGGYRSDRRREAVMSGWKRRTFLTATSGVVCSGTAIQRGLAATGGQQQDVDFERLVRSIFESVPEDEKELKELLAEIANKIRTTLSPLTPDAIDRAMEETWRTSAAARRLQFGIEILHNNNIARYLDDGWVVLFRDKLGKVTRVLPLVGSFNNVYHYAQALDKSVQSNWLLSSVDEEKFENFVYSMAAFCLEIGLWAVGAPYKMAWRGTRFVSNRTLLRAINYLDNRLVGLLMSEIHWKIREEIYESVSAENIGATVEELEYYVNQFDELGDAAEGYELRDGADSYLREVEVDVDRSDLREFDFIGGSDADESSSDEGEMTGWLDGVF